MTGVHLKKCEWEISKFLAVSDGKIKRNLRKYHFPFLIPRLNYSGILMNRLARSAKNHKAPVKETIISPKITKLSASGIGFWPIQDIRFGGVGEGGTQENFW